MFRDSSQPRLCNLHLNGGSDTGDETFWNTRSIYAHEFGHAIDWSADQPCPLSATKAWRETGSDEKRKIRERLGVPNRGPAEDFANFAGVAWAYTEDARRHYPECWGFWINGGLAAGRRGALRAFVPASCGLPVERINVHKTKWRFHVKAIAGDRAVKIILKVFVVRIAHGNHLRELPTRIASVHPNCRRVPSDNQDKSIPPAHVFPFAPCLNGLLTCLPPPARLHPDGPFPAWPVGWAAAAVAAVVLRPQPVYAMHISDGFLTPAWSGLWFLAAAPFSLWGLWCMRRRQAAEPRTMTLVGLVGSAVFVISCLHVPVPWEGTCSHACGTGLAAILIGPGATIVVSVLALLFQLLLLQEGGFTTLAREPGLDGRGRALGGAACFCLLRRLRLPVLVAAFAAGTLSDWAVYAASSFQLASARHGDKPLWGVFAAVLLAYVPTQVPLGIFEGF